MSKDRRKHPLRLTTITRQLGVLLIPGLLLSVPVQASEPSSVNQQRSQAVAAARSGHLEAAIDRLQRLHQAHPRDRHVLADLVVLLRQAGHNAEIVRLTAPLDQGSDLPSYALLPWASAERDEHHYHRARQLLKGNYRALGAKGAILYAMVTSEDGMQAQAVKLLPPATTQGLDANDLAHMAYVHRRAQDPTSALRLSTRSLALAPHNTLARQEQIYALSDLGATHLAAQLAQQHPHLIPPAQRDRLLANQAAADIHEAIDDRRRLEDQYRFGERNQALHGALSELNQHIQHFPANSTEALRSRYDRILVLRELEFMPEAVQAYESLQQPEDKIPPYVRRAAADAYLANRQPCKAEHLYRQLIQANPGIDVEVYLNLYYALIESEQYDEALTLIDKLHRITPIWLYRRDGGKGRAPNWERLDVDYVWVLDAAYRNHEAVAEQRARTLFNQAPRNVGLINTYATVLRWRGWPERAHQVTQLARAYDPKAKDTRINVAENARDLEQFDVWGRTITPLKRQFPHDTTIDKSYAAWQDRKRPSISSEFIIGLSHGGNSVYGNRDREWKSRLNSPWTDNGWRAFIDHHYLWSIYDTGGENFNRVGAGAEWRWGRKHFWASVSNDRFTGQDVGVAAGWSQWLNDHWQYLLSADSYSTETPLRAHQAGFKGRAYHARVNWRASESRSAYADLGLLDITDGNNRFSFSTGFTQRLQASAHHITEGGIDLYAEHNSRPGGVYYNPANSQSANLRLAHDWITWRHYERSFTQHFEVSTGMDWQSGYGGSPAVDLFYEHQWQLSRTWELHYGIGWGTHVYDGNRERRLYGLIGFSGVF